MKNYKKLALLVTLFLVLPLVSASHHPPPSQPPLPACNFTNFADCFPQKIAEFFLNLLNAPLQPLLSLIQSLLTASVVISIFEGMSLIVRYLLSFFYIFLFLYAGYTFLLANANPIKRARAKELLRDTLIMIVLIQGSFYIYDLVLGLCSILNTVLLNRVDPHFFLLTTDNWINFSLQLFFTSIYVMVLILTVLLLGLRYFVVSLGVVLFPIALFCFYLPPLKSYGRFLLELLAIFIFITTLDLLIILGCSLLLTIPLFQNIKIAVMINCFLLILYSLYWAIKFSISRSAFSGIKDDINSTIQYVAMIA